MKDDPELDNREFIEKIRQTLASESDDLDAVTTARLQAIRKTVIADSVKSSGVVQHPTRWVIASSFAMALLVVSLVAINMNSQADLNIMDDLHILSEKESIDFYENMEFYQLLDEAESNG